MHVKTERHTDTYSHRSVCAQVRMHMGTYEHRHVCIQARMLKDLRGRCPEEYGMTCKDFSSMIPSFMDDTLDNESLRSFLNHLNKCKGCREELEIQYLVNKVFDQMDVGEEINLSKDLPAYIEKEEKLLYGRERLAGIAAIVEVATITAAVLTVIIYLM